MRGTRSSGMARRRRRRGREPEATEAMPARDQEAEVRARLYGKLLPAERTVEILGPIPRQHRHRPAA